MNYSQMSKYAGVPTAAAELSIVVDTAII